MKDRTLSYNTGSAIIVKYRKGVEKTDMGRMLVHKGQSAATYTG